MRPAPARAGPRGRGPVVFCGLVLAWWGLALLFRVPSFMLPTPDRVAVALWSGRDSLARNALVTASEIVLGLGFGLLLGAGLALAMTVSRPVRTWTMPVLVVSQAIPVFALAPLLVLWFGFGLASKVVMATLVIFFPVTTSFFDGLRRTEPGWIELARTMRASPYAQLRHVRLVAALPAFGSGLRVAAAIAPIGAVIGEWVGSAGGLGYAMLNANARLQTDACFAALFLLALMAVGLWRLVDVVLRRALYWVPDAGTPA